MSWSFRKGGEDERGTGPGTGTGTGTGTVGVGGHRVSPCRFLSVYGDAPDRGEQSDPEVEVVHVAAGDHDAPTIAAPRPAQPIWDQPPAAENGGYQQHFDTQQQPGFTGYPKARTTPTSRTRLIRTDKPGLPGHLAYPEVLRTSTRPRGRCVRNGGTSAGV